MRTVHQAVARWDGKVPCSHACRSRSVFLLPLVMIDYNMYFSPHLEQQNELFLESAQVVWPLCLRSLPVLRVVTFSKRASLGRDTSV
jgi:hypothetical protein